MPGLRQRRLTTGAVREQPARGVSKRGTVARHITDTAWITGQERGKIRRGGGNHWPQVPAAFNQDPGAA